MSKERIIERTAEYLTVPSVVGFECPFLNHLKFEFLKACFKVEDRGRLLAVRRDIQGPVNPRILTAHIDRHGIVFNAQRQFEYAAFRAKKDYGMDNTSSESLFDKSGRRFVDEPVFATGFGGIKIGEGVVKRYSVDFDRKDLLFEVEGMTDLPPNTPVAYVSQLQREDGTLSSQIDNVICVAVARQLMEDGFDGTLLLTTEEEIGRSWQQITSYLTERGLHTQEMVVLDTTPYTDERAIQEGLVVLRNKDENGTFNPELVRRLRATCESGGFRHEFKDEVIKAANAELGPDATPKKLGKTELGRVIQHTNGRFNGATVQLPTTNYHTNHETTSELALGNFY